MMCAEQEDNLLERGSEGVCCETVSCEAVISVCDDARVRVALLLLVHVTYTGLYGVKRHYVSLNDLANEPLSCS